MSPAAGRRDQFAARPRYGVELQLTSGQSQPGEIVYLLLELDLRQTTTDERELFRGIIRVEQVGALLLGTSTVVIVVLLVTRSRLSGFRLLSRELLVLLRLLQLELVGGGAGAPAGLSCFEVLEDALAKGFNLLLRAIYE